MCFLRTVVNSIVCYLCKLERSLIHWSNSGVASKKTTKLKKIIKSVNKLMGFGLIYSLIERQIVGCRGRISSFLRATEIVSKAVIS